MLRWRKHSIIASTLQRCVCQPGLAFLLLLTLGLIFNRSFYFFEYRQFFLSFKAVDLFQNITHLENIIASNVSN